MYTVVITMKKAFAIHSLMEHKAAYAMYHTAIRSPTTRTATLYGDAGLIIDERFPEIIRGDKLSNDAAAIIRGSGLHKQD